MDESANSRFVHARLQSDRKLSIFLWQDLSSAPGVNQVSMCVCFFQIVEKQKRTKAFLKEKGMNNKRNKSIPHNKKQKLLRKAIYIEKSNQRGRIKVILSPFSIILPRAFLVSCFVLISQALLRTTFINSSKPIITPRMRTVGFSYKSISTS